MKITLRIMTFMIFCFTCSQAFALEWKVLHEKAHFSSLDEVQAYYNEDPNDINRQYTIGIKHLMLHDSTKGGEIFEQMVTENPDLVEAKWGLGEARWRDVTLDQRDLQLQEILELDPNFVPALISMAHLKYLKRKYSESTTYTARVIRLGDEKVDVRNLVYAHGLYSASRGMMSHFGNPIYRAYNGFSAMRHLKKVRKLDSESFINYYGWGSFYTLAPKFLGGDIKKGERYLNKAVEVDSLWPEPYVRLAQIYKKRGEIEKYEQYIQKALDLDPDNAFAVDIRDRKCHYVCLEDVKK